MLIKYDYLGVHNAAEYFKYEIDYSDPAGESLTDSEILRGAHASGEHYGGMVYRDDCTVVVYSAGAQADEFEIDGGTVAC